MAQPSTFVNNFRGEVTGFMTSWERLRSQMILYNSLGGQPFVDTYLKDAGIDVSTDDFVTAIAAAEKILQVLEDQFFQDSLNKMRI
jgi:hypothetical protein